MFNSSLVALQQTAIGIDVNSTNISVPFVPMVIKKKDGGVIVLNANTVMALETYINYYGDDAGLIITFIGGTAQDIKINSSDYSYFVKEQEKLAINIKSKELKDENRS